MKLLLPFCCFMFFLVLSESCAFRKTATPAVTKVYHLDDSLSVRDGSLIYALPLTVLKINAEFLRIVEKPGPYAKYAPDMLGLKDVISVPAEKWMLIGIRVKIEEEVDPSEFYVIESNTSLHLNALALKKSGLIMDINAGDVLSADGKQGEAWNPIQLSDFTDMGSDEYFITQSDTAYRTVKLDTAFIKIPYLVEKKKPLSLEQMADKAAKNLLELRDGKMFILTGEANVFPQAAAGIDEINKLEREYTSLFTGKRIPYKKTLSYTFIPSEGENGRARVLFHFSEKKGPSATPTPGSVPVIAELSAAEKIKDITIVQANTLESTGTQSFDKLFYRFPDVATLRIKSGSETVLEDRVLVFQFGQVLQLPANFIIGK